MLDADVGLSTVLGRYRSAGCAVQTDDVFPSTAHTIVCGAFIMLEGEADACRTSSCIA